MQDSDPVSYEDKTARGRRRKWWTRLGRSPRTFRYRTIDGDIVQDQAHLERIKNLAIPPAWRFVRISPSFTSDLLAVGVDAADRIQYIYHSKFRRRQERNKFRKIELFGEYLGIIRDTTNQHLALETYSKEKVLAIMLRLVNSLYFRVGTEKSVRSYKTYGITTLRNDHLKISRNGKLVFSFVGKSHVKHRKVMVDQQLAAELRQLSALGPKRKLFNYLDELDRPRPIKPSDINRYLKSLTASEFSIKDFRTWGGTLLAATELAKIGYSTEEKVRHANTVKVVRRVSEHLGNTPAVCRQSYIHPAIFDAYSRGVLLQIKPAKSKRGNDWLTPEEKGLIELFKGMRWDD